MTRSYTQYCDFSRQYDPDPSPAVLPDGTTVPVYHGPPVDTFLLEFARFDLLDYSAYTPTYFPSGIVSYSPCQ